MSDYGKGYGDGRDAAYADCIMKIGLFVIGIINAATVGWLIFHP